MIVVWRVTTHCNHSCRFCAFDQSLPRARTSVSDTLLEHVGHLLKDYRQQTGRPVLLSWLGGEPFLWKPMFSATERLSSAGLRLSATTNGSTLGNAEHRRWALTYLNEITISIDGPAEVHDKVRGTPSGWRKLKAHVLQLAEERSQARSSLKLRVNTVLMKQNVAHFAQQCEEWASWGIEEITFNQLGGKDRPEFYPGNRLLSTDAAYLRDLIPDLRHRLASMGVNLSGSERYLERISRSAAGKTYPIIDCSPGEQLLFIDERGLVSPCSFTCDDYGIPASGLHTWRDLRDLSASWREMQMRRRSPACDDCMATHQFAKFQS